MTSEGHTPGPWYVDGDVVCGDYGRHPYGESVVCEPMGDDQIQAAANARLIASAPELYEALRDVLAECEDYARADGDIGDNEPECLSQARAVLAKIEGNKQPAPADPGSED